MVLFLVSVSPGISYHLQWVECDVGALASFHCFLGGFFCDSRYLDNGRPVYLFSNCPDFFQLVKHHTSSAKGTPLAEPSWMISVPRGSTCSGRQWWMDPCTMSRRHKDEPATWSCYLQTSKIYSGLFLVWKWKGSNNEVIFSYWSFTWPWKYFLFWRLK